MTKLVRKVRRVCLLRCAREAVVSKIRDGAAALGKEDAHIKLELCSHERRKVALKGVREERGFGEGRKPSRQEGTGSKRGAQLGVEERAGEEQAT